jgi:lipoprotein-anchoring transpeptidase ErfK/SrfK
MRSRLLLIFVLTLVPAQLARAATTADAARATAQKPIAALSGPISNERTTTYWAYSVEKTPIRSGPHARSRRIAMTTLWTEDGFPQNYLVLAQDVYRNETWFQIRIPGRPNGRIGWVPEQALGTLHVSHKLIVVNKRLERLTLYLWGRKIFSAPAGTGTPSTPTPDGHFWVREKFAVHPADPFYGPYAFGTSDYSVLSEWPHGGVVGIHGTDQPNLIPGDPSHGCVRMKDADITKLFPLVSVGTPVWIKG